MKILKTGSFFQPNKTSTNAQIHEAKITLRDVDVVVVTWE